MTEMKHSENEKTSHGYVHCFSFYSHYTYK